MDPRELEPLTTTLPARSRSVLAAALAALLLGATLVSAHATEPASSPATPGPDMITTRLHPGWNSVGWVGAEAHAAELFDAIPMLWKISAYDSEEHRYREVIWTSTPRRDIGALTPGRALWLYVAGDAPIEWRRRASADGVLLSLQAGLNFVGWSGRDGATIEDAVARFGDALGFVARWNAQTRRYEYYDPAARDAANTLSELHRGDALWVELSGDARWWQSEAARTDFVFRGTLSPQRQADARAMMANVVTFFAERYGIEPPPFSVIVDPELDTSASPGVIRLGQFYHPSLSELEGTLAHEYFHVLQSHLSRRGAFSPRWMSEGTAHYAEGLYNAVRGASTDEKVRTQWWLGSQIPETLRAIEQVGPFLDTGAGGYNAGALATDWLVRRAAAAPAGGVSFTPFEPAALDEQAAHDSYIEYYRLLPSSASWREAFRTAFGITTHDFYTAFEAYRAALIGARLPHRADDRDKPILVLVGDIPRDAAAALRAEFGTLQALFTERFGDVPADYTIFVAADAESAAPNAAGTEPPRPRASRPRGWYRYLDDTTQARQTFSRSSRRER